jgi:hypothetical protein
MTDSTDRTVRTRGRRQRPTRAAAVEAAQEASFTAEVTCEEPYQLGGSKSFAYYARPSDADADAQPITFVSLEGTYAQGETVTLIQRKAKGEDSEAYFTDAKNPDPNGFVMPEPAPEQDDDDAPEEALPIEEPPIEDPAPTAEAPPIEEPVPVEEAPKTTKTRKKKPAQTQDVQESIPIEGKVTVSSTVVASGGTRDVVLHIPDALIQSGRKVSVTVSVDIS